MESSDSAELNKIFSTMRTFVYRDDIQYEKEINNLLGTLNGLDFSRKLCEEKVVAEVVNKLCYLVPADDESLVAGFALVIFNLVSRQQIVLEGGVVDTVIDYILKALQHTPSMATSDSVLRALGAVLYLNGARIEKHEAALIGKDGVLRHIITRGNEELLRSAVQCVENVCIRITNHPYLSADCQAQCVELFLHVLQHPKPQRLDEVAHCKVLMSSLRGLQHIFQATRSCTSGRLGSLLAVMRAYMVFGVVEMTDSCVDACLYPTPLGQTSSQSAQKQPTSPGKDEAVSLRPGGNKQAEGQSPAASSARKGKKKRNQKGKQGKDTASEETVLPTTPTNTKSPHQQSQHSSQPSSTTPHTYSSLANQNLPDAIDPLALYPTWSKASSSDSEFSDAEGASGAAGVKRARAFHVKVRQSTLACFLALVKACEKKTLFGYWSSFLPNTPGQGTSSTIFMVAMRDPSAKVRTGALAVLTALLEGSKQFLQAAEDSEQYRAAPFTPFSVTLGYMIKEIHRCLMLSLTSEQSPLATTQIIKCLATLIPCVPYHRLRPGLLTRVMKQIKPFMSHRDPNIRVACLSCMGAMVSVQAPLLEVTYILQASRSTNRQSDSSSAQHTQTTRQSESSITQHTHAIPPTSHQMPTSNSEYVQLESAVINQPPTVTHQSETNHAANVTSKTETGNTVLSENLGASFNYGSQGYSLFGGGSGVGGGSGCGSSPGITTPQLSSGAQTPSLADSMTSMQLGGGGTMSWLVRLCVKNTAPQLLEKQHDDSELPSRVAAESSPARIQARTERYVQPLPVRLESLQVLAAVCKSYFSFLRPVLSLMSDVIQCCLKDSDVSVQLHGAKLLDEIGTVTTQKLKDEDSGHITTQQVLEFWSPLLAGPVPTTLQTSSCSSVRATLCDCLSTIAPGVFNLLSTDKHIVCMTLTLGLTSDEDHYVRASAVRTLGMYAFVPAMRQDVTFIADAANAIVMATEENLLAVKVKAMWSLGNLTDALATNKESEEDASFTDAFSDMLLLKLFEVATRGAADTDKVRSNAVRALGNLVRYLPERCLQSSRFNGAVLEKGVKAMVKNVTTGPMKVRWNACYAIGNMLKNNSLVFSQMPWMDTVLVALHTAVRACKNFKVRINAALSLSVPQQRAIYGPPHKFAQTWRALVDCLHNAETTTDLAEYKYSEALNHQILDTMVHLLQVIESADIGDVTDLITENAEFLSGHAAKLMSKASEEPHKLVEVQKMQTHLQSLRENSREPDKQCIQMLLDIFKPKAELKEDTKDQEPPPPQFTMPYD